MKKFFKSPDEAKQSDAKSVIKILKKVFSKGVEGVKFFYKAEFEYENGEKAPFMYIGAPAGHWKKFIKESKKDKDFVAGFCKLEQEEGKLLLEAKMGKGSKAMFLKAVNKELLKKNGVKAEFVDALPIEIELEEEEEDVLEEGTAAVSPEEIITEIKDISTTFKTIRKQHDAEQIDALMDQLQDWKDNFSSLSAEQKGTLGKEKEHAQKISALLQQINQIDSRVDALMEKIYPLIDEYLNSENHESAEAQGIKAKIERSIVKIEVLAEKINDHDFIEACKSFREIIAD